MTNDDFNENNQNNSTNAGNPRGLTIADLLADPDIQAAGESIQAAHRSLSRDGLEEDALVARELTNMQRLPNGQPRLVRLDPSGDWYENHGGTWTKVDDAQILKTVNKRLHGSFKHGDYTAGLKRFGWGASVNIAPEDAITRTQRGTEYAAVNAVRVWLDSDDDIEATCYDDNWLICRNGILNIQTGQFCQQREAVIPLAGYAPNYEAEADCPRFKAFLRQITAGDQGLIDSLQFCAAAALVGTRKCQRAWYLFGPAGRGKSVFLKVLQGLAVGAFSTLSPEDLSGAAARFRSAELATNRLIVFEEAFNNNKRTLPPEFARVFKNAVTGGAVTVERKYKDPYTLPARATFVFASNFCFPASEEGEALSDRLILVPINGRKVRETPEEDPLFAEHLLEGEGSGILNWALSGVRKLESLGWRVPRCETSIKAMEAIRDDLNPDCAWIRENVFPVHPKALQWLEERGIKPPMIVVSELRKKFQAYGAEERFSDYLYTGKRFGTSLKAVTGADSIPAKVDGALTRVLRNFVYIGQQDCRCVVGPWNDVYCNRNTNDFCNHGWMLLDGYILPNPNLLVWTDWAEVHFPEYVNASWTGGND